MSLIYHNITKLTELKKLTKELSPVVYVRKNSLLSGATIGQHFRHIIEFYNCIQNGHNQNFVCYDDRKRDELIETEQEYAINKIHEAIFFLNSIKKDKSIDMHVNYSVDKNEKITVSTSLFRELAYALDHTIHHLAIVKIALQEEEIELSNDFGVAPSTLIYQKSCAQ